MATYKGGKRRKRSGVSLIWVQKGDVHYIKGHSFADMGADPSTLIAKISVEEQKDGYSIYGYIRKRGKMPLFSDEYPFVTKPKLKEYMAKMKKKVEEEMKKHMMGV